MSLALPVPRVLSDAVEIANNPGAYADRPSLIHLARQVLITAAAGIAPNQITRQAANRADLRRS